MEGLKGESAREVSGRKRSYHKYGDGDGDGYYRLLIEFLAPALCELPTSYVRVPAGIIAPAPPPLSCCDNVLWSVRRVGCS